jgi:hypothetical protein
MLSFLFYVLWLSSQVHVVGCDQFKRLDGSTVTVCDGHVIHLDETYAQYY